MSVVHLKKRDVMKSKVRGVDMEFDHEKLATILGVPGKNEICEYIKEVWEESKYTKPLEITRRFANDENIMAAKEGQGEEPKRYDFFEDTFLTMCKLTRENGIWWIGSGENRRRDDDVDAQEVEAEEEEGRHQGDFDWEAVEEDAAVEGESGSGEKFYDAEDKDQGSPEVHEEIPAAAPQSSAQQKEQGTTGVDPSCPTGRIPEDVMTKLQEEFKERGPTDS
ncbi:hypothetical protein Dimus_003335 [Dionaea muscipula]